MSLVLPISQVRDEDRPRVGGKGFALSRLRRGGYLVPEAVCVTTDAYQEFTRATGLNERILMEIHRKEFKDMRWEEMWDASLRIRNLFLTTPMPASLTEALRKDLGSGFSAKAVVVRSSAPGEDSAKASFAGLHESYVNIRGIDGILDHIRKVWASLWSDAALLYRRELGLKPEESAMAVVVQEMIFGGRSGVVFSRNPMEETQVIIESVHGLNQGLVDGTVEPDQWILDRASGRIHSCKRPDRDLWVIATQGGTATERLPDLRAASPPLSGLEVEAVYRAAMGLEKLFGTPQDVEWTFLGERLYILQSRPITTRKGAGREDDRAWYLSLRRSFQNLKALRRKIEDEHIPAMIREASELHSQELQRLSQAELAREMERRSRLHEKWVDIYWREFIPFAHGARLFGQIYNDAVRPSDPYEFMTLLAATEMESLKRNRRLEDMAETLRGYPGMIGLLEKGDLHGLDPGFRERLDAFVQEYGQLVCQDPSPTTCRAKVSGILFQMAGRSKAAPSKKKDLASLTASFLSRFEGEKKEEAGELLDLARASYRLRDDDNIYLGRIESELDASLTLAEERLRLSEMTKEERQVFEALIPRLRQKAYVPHSPATGGGGESRSHVRPRQLTGQPAGPGLGRGRARVITEAAQLAQFEEGEILVCDAVDPNMTFVVPLCAGIVERRGGMLIHGAIIAREYGLPCVTGVPNATSWIHTGDEITVDGYLGIVVLAL